MDIGERLEAAKQRHGALAQYFERLRQQTSQTVTEITKLEGSIETLEELMKEATDGQCMDGSVEQRSDVDPGGNDHDGATDLAGEAGNMVGAESEGDSGEPE